MSRKQQERHKRAVKDSQARKTEFNKLNRSQLIENRKEQAVVKKTRLTKAENRRLKRMRKKKIKYLKSLYRQKLINEDEFNKRMEKLK